MPARPWLLRVMLLALALGATACGRAASSDEASTKVDAPRVITVTSTAFHAGGQIPTRFTCDGGGTSPEVAWRGVPDHAGALALVVDDPDAPSGTFVHWVLLDMSPSTRQVDEDSVPAGAVQAKNGAGHPSYLGPCPPSGTHHYRFTVYALRARTGLHEGAATDTALRAVRKAALAQGRLVGTYSRG